MISKQDIKNRYEELNGTEDVVLSEAVLGAAEEYAKRNGLETMEESGADVMIALDVLRMVEGGDFRDLIA